ncbi:hypothetical protein DRN86_03185 [Candidatus Geothermarchaeota archaeon]|nr:MAG: hypothetical protein DRN86_03185 [Candidatus Geothermarchaeota archaeon]
MRTPCEVVIRHFIPAIRARIAQILIEENGWRQVEVAKALKITQAAVSKYKRILSRESSLKGLIDEIAREMSELIMRNELSATDFIYKICSMCIYLRGNRELCALHKDILPSLIEEKCDICLTKFKIERPIVDERSEVINSIKRAVERIIRTKGYSRLIPEVRTNIVMAIKGAKERKDVAAIPGRITVVKGSVFVPFGPEFGASKHMAEVLLEVMKKGRFRAATCIKYDKLISKALSRCGFKTGYVKHKERGNLVLDLRKSLEKWREVPEVVIDLGGPGVEPVVYIFGENAEEVVDKSIRILNVIQEL